MPSIHEHRGKRDAVVVSTEFTNPLPSIRRAALEGLDHSPIRPRYPEELADRAWDNVGLLQENIDLSSNPGSRPAAPTVLLTNDLTVWVAEEAIRKKVSVIVSYRKSPHSYLTLAAFLHIDPLFSSPAHPIMSRGIRAY